MTDQLLESLGMAVAYGVGLVTISYTVFRLLAIKWLEAKFAERLQDYKHAQNKEIEELRFRINSTFDRVTKLHQKEFDVLPEAWAKLCGAYQETRSLLAVLRTRPDLNRMPEDAMTEFVAGSELLDWQKNKVLKAQNKNQCYGDFIRWHELAKAQEASSACHNYLMANAVFLESTIGDSFSQLDDLIWKAIRDHETYLPHRPTQQPHVEKFRNEAKDLMNELEIRVRFRLHS